MIECERSDEIHIGGVGAGAGGVEVLLAIEHRLRRDLKEAGRASDHIKFHLITDASDILVSTTRPSAESSIVS